MVDIHSFLIITEIGPSQLYSMRNHFYVEITLLHFMSKSEAIFNINVLHGAVFYFHITGPKSLSHYHSDAHLFVTLALIYISNVGRLTYLCA